MSQPLTADFVSPGEPEQYASQSQSSPKKDKKNKADGPTSGKSQ